MKKLISALLCSFLLLGVISCTHKSDNQEEQQTEQQGHQTEQDIYEDQKFLYKDVIAQYTSLLTDKYNGKELVSPNTKAMDPRETEISEALFNVVSALSKPESAKDMGYGFKDFDGNGTPELILLSKYTSVRAILTLSEGRPILLDAVYEISSSIIFAPENRLLVRKVTTNENSQQGRFYTCFLNGDKLAYEFVCVQVYNTETKEVTELYQEVNGERISIDDKTYRTLTSEHTSAWQAGYETTSKLQAPYIYLPLVKSSTDSELPVVDFSSYEAIKDTYLAIESFAKEISISSWALGSVTDPFSFPNDLSFEYYTQLLYIAYYSRGMGYGQTDLNGDGIEELVLLGEDYRIKAIFTQKDGAPVLLDAFASPYEFGWLDGNGFIHADLEGYSELTYRLYEFTKNCEYKHCYTVSANGNGHVLTENGVSKVITNEEAKELYYNSYVCYPATFVQQEYTRNISSLTYTPLVAAADEDIAASLEKTWYKSANITKMTEWDLAYSATLVSFANVTAAQMDMNIKHSFTYYYPDPNRENYLLDETVEETLNFTVRIENGVYLFEGNGIKGRLELGQKYLWLIIEESSDDRFVVGHHCHEIYTPLGTIQ